MPTVFISYSWESDEHKDWVRKLAHDLRANGVDAWLDQWEVELGDDVTKFMERGVSEADFVLLICTDSFGGKANARSGGVGYEQAIVTADILNSQPKRGRFVCALRSGTPSTAIPRYMQSRLFVDFQDASEYEQSLGQLLIHFLDRYDQQKPPLGPTTKDEQSSLPTSPVSDTKLSNWVLVSGTGIPESFTDELKLDTQYLGKQLATEGYGLVTGGWPGVDETVARAFFEAAINKGFAPEDRLIQVIRKDIEPEFAAGQLFFVEERRKEWTEPIQRAGAVLLLGGLGGTLTTGKMALEMNKPVLPLADTDGDAKKMYLQMLREWERYDWMGLNRKQFQYLARPRQDGVDAAISLLELLFS
jgi:hypothetical protein